MLLSIITARAKQALDWLLWTPVAAPPVRPPTPLPDPEPAATAEPALPVPAEVVELSPKLSCSVEGCDRARHARGLCSRHYAQARRRAA